MSLVDILDEVSTPIQLAESAIKKDDHDKLKKLLINPGATSGDQSKLVGEDAFVNAQNEENLLHYAVHECASKCVQLLVRPPYKWSPDRPNLIGRTAAQMAQTRGYLPVWFPLVANSCQAGAQRSYSYSHPVFHFLIYPHELLEKPLSLSERQGYFYAIANQSGPINWQLSAANMALFCELLLSTPAILEQPLPRFLKFWPWSCSQRHHVAECMDYPNCFVDLNTYAVRGEELLRLFSNWAAHRLAKKQDVRDADKSIDGEVASLVNWYPMRLGEQCRVLIRRLLALDLHDQAKKKRVSGSGALNYANSVNQLPLPAPIKAFLAYQELWPPLPRHFVPKTSAPVLWPHGFDL